LAEKLKPDRFIRPHRSVVVNTSAVEEIKSLSTGEYSLRLKGGNEYLVTACEMPVFVDSKMTFATFSRLALHYRGRNHVALSNLQLRDFQYWPILFRLRCASRLR
jgi:hypothetical protein